MCDNDHPDYKLPDIPDASECGPNSQLSEECVQGKKDAFCSNVDGLRNTRSDHSATARADAHAAIAACNGDVACIRQAKADGFDALERIQGDYDSGLKMLRDTFAADLLADCCEETPPQ